SSRRALGALICLLAACSPQQPAAPPQSSVPATPATPAQTEAPEPAIRRLLAQQTEDWNHHDAHAWVAPFGEDAEFINILGMLLTGRDEIERRHAEIFKTIFARSRVVVTVRKVRALGASAA